MLHVGELAGQVVGLSSGTKPRGEFILRPDPANIFGGHARAPATHFGCWFSWVNGAIASSVIRCPVVAEVVQVGHLIPGVRSS